MNVGREYNSEQMAGVVVVPSGTLTLRLSWKYFPSYHTHNWPEGVSLHLNIQRILCFDKITV